MSRTIFIRFRLCYVDIVLIPTGVRTYIRIEDYFNNDGKVG